MPSKIDLNENPNIITNGNIQFGFDNHLKSYCLLMTDFYHEKLVISPLKLQKSFVFVNETVRNVSHLSKSVLEKPIVFIQHVGQGK